APAGVTAAELAALPRLDPKARAAMRADCEAGAARCDRLILLGRLERAALVRALAARDLVVDPAPAGKRVRRILVVTLAPFGQEARWLEWANFFHVDSKPGVIAREVLVRPGDRWVQDDVDETQRKLRDPLFATVAVIVPVRPAAASADPPLADDEVDLLVVNRDIFSLRLNSNYEIQAGQITYLALSLSENNFLGRRKLAALTFTMDQASFAVGPLYIDKNLLGRRLDFRFRGGPIINRDSGGIEGSDGTITLSRPLWSLKSKWSWNLAVARSNTVARSFKGTSLRLFDADGDDTTTDDQVPWRYRLRTASAGGGVVRAWGDGLEQRLGLSYELSSVRPSVQDDLVASTPADVLAAFRDQVLPRSERAGVATATYEIFTAHYRDYVDIDGYDLAEDVRLGPSVSVGLGAALRALGSENQFGTASIDAGWTLPWGGDGLASLAASFSTRLEDDAAIDRSAATTLRVVSPASRLGRIVGELRLSGLFREHANRFFTLGGDNGLRGFPVGAFAGLRRAVAQLDARTRSVRFLLGTRWGLLGFYDVGDAADTVGQLSLHQDVGVGLRALTPQLSREVFRFDLAFPLDGAQRGHPRLILGYQQAF
ncbi:MAG TPA: hypothetical protein VHE35_27775, partial [Kofleriaceae bacterium]|nr:hypothetical protein [Kofleriaceae bacterium]